MSENSEGSLDDDRESNAPSKGNTLLLLAIPVTVVIMLFVMGIFGQKPRGAADASFPTVGDALPEIVAEGWVNGSGPASADLAGHVYVLDVWATWCGPCRGAAAELVELHEKYKDQGVAFIGLSTETARDLPEIQKFIDHFKVTWPNGYGADRTINQLAVEWIPRVWVVGKDGKVVWENSLQNGSLEEGIKTALAR